ncbi:MAG TPA: cupin domain-containing protein [Syntrophorhabdaceae bacterium]|jgi:cupin 2 domain-containing protein|nr:cupin domain-containing protein [Syntrophorhabdaceae bacterium]MDI9560590.1 cupin domain-containing protein [Pseudomonadota bacterium]OQC47121.1 MAG: Cupin domain protein [Deltaproteobacteria bacterium ADurb.Bin026]MBP8698170.1 cupin domain-containing protein [Syntrophorhabdaceae bacterium]MBV6504591.1 hypothetical protein [Syntrophorhabdaceae bacterium]
MNENIRNIFECLHKTDDDEYFETMLEANNFKLERIISNGQITPCGQWYDQERDEWVVLLTGAAVIMFEDEAEPIIMKPGDYINIPAHKRHRVEWTDQSQKTVWLALHYSLS